MKILLYLTVAFILFSQPAMAQLDKPEEPQTYICVYPQHLLINALKLELIRPYKPNLSSVFSSSLIYDYNGEPKDNNYPYANGKIGIGLGYGFMRETPRKNSDVTYAILEISSAYVQYTITDEVFAWYNEGGLNIGKFGERKFDHNIVKLASMFTVGSRTADSEYFQLHVFAGIGLQYAYHYNDINSTRYFSNYITQNGYTGLIVSGGIKIGFLL